MNRIITQLVLGFVLGSIAATLLPLLESGDGLPLVTVMDRSTSLAIYASYLVVWFVFLFPGFMARDLGPSRRPTWIVLAVLLLLFAAIPLVFTAYISGVSKEGLVSIVGIAALAAGLPLAMDRLAKGVGLAGVLRTVGIVALFLVPALAVYLATQRIEFAGELARFSLFHWIHRIAVERQVLSPFVFLVPAAACWLVALLPRGARKATPALGSALVLLFIAPAGDPGVRTAELRLESLSGGVARAGLRAPLRLCGLDPDAGAIVEIGNARYGIRASEAGAFLVGTDPTAPRARIRVVADTGKSFSVTGIASADPGWKDAEIPNEIVSETIRLVGWIAGTQEESAGIRVPDGEGIRVVSLESATLPLGSGALEAFDAIVVAKSTLRRLPSHAASLRAFASLGGRLVVVESSGEARTDRQLAAGRMVEVSAGIFSEADLGAVKPKRAGSVDPELLRAFAPPHWQEMDLSALLFFALIYHGAFLLAFLLPLLLDSRKSRTVYLASVAFVVTVVALLAWKVLGNIFLRDNQVYTQSLTFVVADGNPDARMAVRQFLGFASMSGEERDVVLDGAADVTFYRTGGDATLPCLVAGARGTQVLGARLDRFRGKVMVRIDRDVEGPLRIVRDGDGPGTFRVEVAPEVPDPLALREAVPVEGWIVDDGRLSKHLRTQGSSFVVDEHGSLLLPAGVEVFFRRVVGNFAPAFKRFLVLRFSASRRPDDEASYFVARDLGTYMLLPLDPF